MFVLREKWLWSTMDTMTTTDSKAGAKKRYMVFLLKGVVRR
jgi:hypothetical protein